MPKYTPNLNIQLADPATDGNQTFNIETMINDPVEKLDEALGLVPVSGDVRAATTGNIVLSGAQTIDGIALAAGNRVLVKNQTAGKENGIYTVASGAWTRAVDANSTAKLAAGISVYVEEGAANGKSRWQMANTGAVNLDTTAITFEKTGGAASATDAIIGSRTISDATAPTGDTGTVTTLFGWLGSMIKAITGGATWRTLPGMSIAAIKTVLDAASNLGTASTLMKRDASGRAQVAAPSAAADIARKDTVDGAIMTYMGGQYRADLNAATTVGVYNFGPDTLNKPIDGYGAVEVFVSDGLAHNNTNNWIWQRAVVVESGPPFNRMVWLRKKINSGAWEAWTTLSSETVADITYYVRTDGNDNNTGTANTAGGAFKTIGKAVTMIPKMVNHTVTINVAAGTYAEVVVLDGFVTKKAGLKLVATGACNVTSIEVVNCHGSLEVSGFTATTTSTDAFMATNTTRITFSSCVATASCAYTAFAFSAANAHVTNCTASNHQVAVAILAESIVYASNNTGSGNVNAYLTAFASYCGYSGTTPSGNMGALEGATLASNGIINPWGDNTTDSRSHVYARGFVAQSLTAAQWNTLLFTDKVHDHLGEYNSATGRFTAKKSGIYLISAAFNPQNVTDGFSATLSVWINSGRMFDGGYSRTGGPGSTSYQISIQVKLTGGDYVELATIPTTNCVTVAGGAYNYCNITQIG